MTFAYDPHTRRRQTVTTGPGVSSSYSYDDFGRESRKVLNIWGPTFVTDFEHDLLGRITKIVYPSPNADVTYEYNGAHLVSVCGRSDGDCAANPDDYYISDVSYDALGRPTDVAMQPGDHHYGYDPTTHQLDESRLTNGSGDDLLHFTYGYDPAGNIATILDQHTGVGSDNLDASASYLYDHRNRLRQRTLRGATTYFQYDELGNLTGRDLANETDPPNQIYADPARPHALSQRADGAAYAYDANGNVIQRGSQHLTFGWQNRLTCVGTSAGACDITSYAYDADGQRIAQPGTGGGLRIFVDDLFEWDMGNNTAEAHVYAFGRRIATQVSTNASLREAWAPVSWPLPIDPRVFGWGLGILAAATLLAWGTQSGAVALILTRPATAGTAIVLVFAIAIPAYAGGGGDSDWYRRWVHHDHLGSAALVTNEAGDVIHRRVFEPFGLVIAETTSPTEESDQLFTGKEWTASTGIYDFHARQYDPQAGRFLSVDPIVQSVRDPQTHNPYSYARNNPVVNVDPNGMWFQFSLAIIISWGFTTDYGRENPLPPLKGPSAKAAVPKFDYTFPAIAIAAPAIVINPQLAVATAVVIGVGVAASIAVDAVRNMQQGGDKGAGEDAAEGENGLTETIQQPAGPPVDPDGDDPGPNTTFEKVVFIAVGIARVLAKLFGP